MSEEITLQENETTERTIEVNIERNGLGVDYGQAFPSVTVNFAPIHLPTNVDWNDILGKPDVVTRVFDDVENFDILKVGDVFVKNGVVFFVRNKEEDYIKLCTFDESSIYSVDFEKNQDKWKLLYEKETIISLEKATVGNFVFVDEHGNIADSGSSPSDFVSSIEYNPRDGDFVYKKGDVNGTDVIIISRDDLRDMILSEIDSFTMKDDENNVWEVRLSTSGELITEKKLTN